jgi:hypothetical protein
MSLPVQLISATLSASLLTVLLGLGPSCTPSTREKPTAPAAAPTPTPAEAPPAKNPETPPAETPSVAPETVDAAEPVADASKGSKDGYVKCPERRSNMCTKIYLPVCADVDTGIRCVRAPCPSIEQKTYASDCTACSDTKVIGHRPGACKEAQPSGGAPRSNAPSMPGAVAE